MGNQERNRIGRWIFAVAAMVCPGAITTQAALPPGSVVLSNNWQGLSGTIPPNPWPSPLSFMQDDDGPANAQWGLAGVVDTNRTFSFRAGEGSPFDGNDKNVGLVLTGNPNNNGPRLNGGTATLQYNPAGLVIQFDTKINRLDTSAGLRSYYWPRGDQFGIFFGSYDIYWPPEPDLGAEPRWKR